MNGRHPVTATYNGWCPACGERIVADVDDVIYSEADQAWVHYECDDE
jgi:hypothetical protein